jgi:Tol biopolymer transport system component
MVRSAAWSPKGDSIAIVRNDSLIVQPLTGSGSRLVGVGPGRQLHSCVWSPRTPWIACIVGNWLAFEAGPLFGNEAPSGIVLFPAAGGTAIDLTGNGHQHKSPAWSADGKFLWMLSDRDGSPGEVYAVPIGSDGHSAGPFVRVGLSAESIGLSAGRIAYSVPVRRANIWAVPVPGDTELLLSKVGTQITSGTQLIELVNTSDDHKWLVYDSNLHGNADIFRLPTRGGAAERLTDDPRPEYMGAISPNGRDLAWHRWVHGERHLFVKRLDSDSAVEIIPVPGDQGSPHWSPDGRSLAAWSHNKEAGAVFVVHRDPHGTWMRPAWRLEGGQLPVWSGDGRTIALIRYDGGISTIPADSGAQRSVYTPRPESADPIVSQLVWSLDPSIIWFVGSDTRGRGGVWSVPATGGAARLRVSFDDPSGRSHGPGLSTDGSRFYFTLDERFSNVRWAELVKR